MSRVVHHSLISEIDIYLFKSGKHFRIHEKLGSHLTEIDGVKGTYFAVWAPNAHRVAVVGDFNGWNNTQHNMNPRWDGSGIWELFIAGVEKGNAYKYYIDSYNQGYRVEKGDPFAIHWETAPKTATIVWDSRRVYAYYGAPVLRFLGLSARRLFRPYEPFWYP